MSRHKNLQVPSGNKKKEDGSGTNSLVAVAPKSLAKYGGHTNLPPGLEVLSKLDGLLISQKVELLETLVGYETKNKYIVRTRDGRNVFFAIENTNCWTRNCCGPARPFHLQIIDLQQQRDVIHVERKNCACDDCCCFPCCRSEIEVSSPPGTIIGSVREDCTFFKPAFQVKNEAGDTVLKIQGPFCTSKCCRSVDFRIQTRDGLIEIGKISKHWSGLTNELFTDADLFGISFPINLDVRTKTVLLGACFLIDFMFFEDSDEGAIFACAN